MGIRSTKHLSQWQSPESKFTEIPQLSITNISLKVTYLKSLIVKIRRPYDRLFPCSVMRFYIEPGPWSPHDDPGHDFKTWWSSFLILRAGRSSYHCTANSAVNDPFNSCRTRGENMHHVMTESIQNSNQEVKFELLRQIPS